jgi:hypothetical protein
MPVPHPVRVNISDVKYADKLLHDALLLNSLDDVKSKIREALYYLPNFLNSDHS